MPGPITAICACGITHPIPDLPLVTIRCECATITIQQTPQGKTCEHCRDVANLDPYECQYCNGTGEAEAAG